MRLVRPVALSLSLTVVMLGGPAYLRVEFISILPKILPTGSRLVTSSIPTWGPPSAKVLRSFSHASCCQQYLMPNAEAARVAAGGAQAHMSGP